MVFFYALMAPNEYLLVRVSIHKCFTFLLHFLLHKKYDKKNVADGTG